jgi:hypothetical protein
MSPVHSFGPYLQFKPLAILELPHWKFGFEFRSELGYLCASFYILIAILEAFLAEILWRVDEIHCPRIKKETGENTNP